MQSIKLVGYLSGYTRLGTAGEHGVMYIAEKYIITEGITGGVCTVSAERARGGVEDGVVHRFE
jgi:hypothetical protein